MIKLFTGTDFFAPIFLNGVVLDPYAFKPQNIKIQGKMYDDHCLFNKITAGLEFFEDLAPANVNIVAQIATRKIDYEYIYAG